MLLGFTIFPHKICFTGGSTFLRLTLVCASQWVSERKPTDNTILPTGVSAVSRISLGTYLELSFFLIAAGFQNTIIDLPNRRLNQHEYLMNPAIIELGKTTRYFSPPPSPQKYQGIFRNGWAATSTPRTLSFDGLALESQFHPREAPGSHPPRSKTSK